jgi:hypothetical protein
VFANIILFLAIRQSKKEMMEFCQKESELELSARNIEPDQTQEATLRESTFIEPLQFAGINDDPIMDPVKEDIRTLRVLVLDENEISRHVLQQLLTSWGLRNEAATDLSHFIAKLKAAEKTMRSRYFQRPSKQTECSQ